MQLTRSWAFLLVLSAASTIIAASGRTGPAISLIILILAWIKGRIILRSYLGLDAAPAIGRGFDLALGGFMLLVMGLAAASG